jgi:hypothetical protein
MRGKMRMQAAFIHLKAATIELVGGRIEMEMEMDLGLRWGAVLRTLFHTKRQLNTGLTLDSLTALPNPNPIKWRMGGFGIPTRCSQLI